MKSHHALEKRKNVLNRFLFALVLFALAVNSYALTRYEVVLEAIEQCDTWIDKEIVKAIAWQESGWRQYKDDKPFHVGDDWGVMQINEKTAKFYKHWSLKKAKHNTAYNVSFGVQILEDKFKWVKENRTREFDKKYRCWGQSNMDIAIRAYNGINKSSKYLKNINIIMEEKPWNKKGR